MNTHTDTAINNVTQAPHDADSSPLLTIPEALAASVYQPGRTMECLELLYAGILDKETSITSSHLKLDGPATQFCWHGGFPHTEEARKAGKPAPVGEYFSPNLYDVAAIKRELKNPTKPRGWKKGDRLDPLRVVKTRGGIGAKDIKTFCASFAEIDDLPLDEQAEKLAWLEAETGFTFTVVTLSGDTRPASVEVAGVLKTAVVGGKSLHAFLALRPTTAGTWQQIQFCLIALLKSDFRLVNPDRLMRLPGAMGYTLKNRYSKSGFVRIQTVVRTAPTLYDAEDILARLEALCARVGVVPESRGVATSSRSKGSNGGTTTHLREMDVYYLERSHEMLMGGKMVNTHAWILANIPRGEEVKMGNPCDGEDVLEHFSTFYRHDEEGFIHIDSFAGTTRAGMTTYRFLEDNSSLVIDEDGFVQGLAVDGGTTSTNPTPRVHGMDARNYDPEGYLPHDPLTHRVTFIKAPYGKGKTEAARAMIEQLLAGNPDASIAGLTHRRSLARQLSLRLGIPLYLDATGAFRNGVISLDSLRRLETLDIDPDTGEVSMREFDLIIIDEVSQVLRHLYGGTLSGPESTDVFDRLQAILKRAKRIVCMDADLNLSHIKWIRGLMGLDAEVTTGQEVRLMDAPPAFTYRLDQDQAQTDRDMLQEWADGCTLAIHCQSRRHSEAVVLMLQKSRPEADIMLVNSDTILRPDVQGFMENADQAAAYDALVYTGSIGTGVSITVRNHFDRIYVYSREGVGTAQDLFQAAHRVRHPANREIRLCVPQGRQGRAERDPVRIYENLIAMGDATVRWWSKDGVTRTADHAVGTLVTTTDDDGHEMVTLDPWRTAHTRLYSEVLAEERKNGGPGGDRRKAVEAHLAAMGATYIMTEPLDPEDTKDVKALTKAARREARDTRDRRIFGAAPMTMEEVEAVREPKDREQADSIERARLLDFYGTITLELVHRDDEGALRTKARRLGRLMAFQTNREKVTALDLKERKAGVPASHAGFHVMHAVAITQLLGYAGLTGCPSTWGDKTLDIGENFSRFAKNNRRVLSALGVTVRKDVEENPTQLVGAVLDKLGLSLGSTKSNGERTYRVSQGSVTLMTTLSKKYLTRLLTWNAPPKATTGAFTQEWIEEFLAPDQHPVVNDTTPGVTLATA